MRSAAAIDPEGKGKKSVKPKGFPASIMPPSMRSWPGLRRLLRVSNGLAAPMPANDTLSSMIWTGTKMLGSMSGALCCGRTPPSSAASDRCPRCLERTVRPSARPLAWTCILRLDPRGRRHHRRHPSRRRHRDRETRLLAIAHGLLATAEIGLKEHDRLTLAKTMMDRKLDGRRASSRLPELVELVMAKPLVSAGMVAKTLEVTLQAARRIVLELGLREMTGRGRFLAWAAI